VGRRNAPTIINAAYADVLFWDGRAANLEEQALMPIENPIEMGHTLQDLVEQLNAIPGYQQQFEQVFGTDVTSDGIAKALAAFQRTILSGNSPYDRYMTGDDSALTETQIRGLEQFDRAGCDICHAPPRFSNFRYYNAGVGLQGEHPDEGRKAATKQDQYRGSFRVPSLREVARTAPYFHDGSAQTLEEAVALMAQGGIANPHRSVMLESVGKVGLNEQDRADIVEFLKALSGEYPVVEPPALP
jgi:cytochrome c peroxidase